MSSPIKLVSLLAFLAGSLVGAFVYSRYTTRNTSPQQLTLEQILSIKELHLVKHVYQDLFFLHKNNNPDNPIRAIAQVPVTVTAFINLKEIQVIHKNDSVKQVILPHAQLSQPNYQIENMIIRETRSLQLHLGRDLYPKVGQYLSATLNTRMEAMRKIAEDNHIRTQAETEAKAYIEMLLKALGRTDVIVTFANTNPSNHDLSLTGKK